MTLYEIVKEVCNLSPNKTLQLGRLEEAHKSWQNNAISYQEYDRELCKIYYACTRKGLHDLQQPLQIASKDLQPGDVFTVMSPTDKHWPNITEKGIHREYLLQVGKKENNILYLRYLDVDFDSGKITNVRKCGYEPWIPKDTSKMWTFPSLKNRV